MKARQKGMSLIGMLIVASLLGFVLVLAFRTVPAVNEYMAIQRIVKLVAEEGAGGVATAELRRSFDRRGQIDDVSTITGADLEISKLGGKVIIDVAYDRKVPVAGNVSLLIEFKASSAAQE